MPGQLHEVVELHRSSDRASNRGGHAGAERQLGERPARRPGQQSFDSCTSPKPPKAGKTGSPA